MKFSYRHENKRLYIEPTRSGVVSFAAFRAVVSFPILAFGAMLYFGLDFAGRTQAGATIAANFWIGVVVLVIFGSLAIGLIGLLRRDRWYFDSSNKEVGFERKMIGGEWSGVTVDASNLHTVIVDYRSKGQPTEIRGEFGNDVETFCRTRLGREAIESVVKPLEIFCTKNGISFEVRE